MLVFKATFLLSVAFGIQNVFAVNFPCTQQQSHGVCQSEDHSGHGPSKGTFYNAGEIDKVKLIFLCDFKDIHFCCPHKVDPAVS
ncbi:hypothetical protein KEM48_001681 [Puccinia striiformis f. sp. tritici PST-130]|nr:hypothetical protein H4Q26_000903 [Puccinia striiformis f. sp. tritici PST-130]KAI9606990.1 hypothetical protein KEM48_001681 [Puccinia striiformis f. sp. tritici PST-130]